MGQKIATSWDKKKMTQPLGTKKLRNLSGQKILQPLGTKKITQLLRTKKNHVTSRDKKIMQHIR